MIRHLHLPLTSDYYDISPYEQSDRGATSSKQSLSLPTVFSPTPSSPSVFSPSSAASDAMCSGYLEVCHVHPQYPPDSSGLATCPPSVFSFASTSSSSQATTIAYPPPSSDFGGYTQRTSRHHHRQIVSLQRRRLARDDKSSEGSTRALFYGSDESLQSMQAALDVRCYTANEAKRSAKTTKALGSASQPNMASSVGIAPTITIARPSLKFADADITCIFITSQLTH